MNLLAVPRLWLCADLSALTPETIVDRLTKVLDFRTETPLGVWLRGTELLPTRPLMALVQTLRTLTTAHHSPLILAQRADLSVLCKSDAVHCTKHSASTSEISAYLHAIDGSFVPRITASVHDVDELRTVREQVSMMLASPYGDVPTKGPSLSFAQLQTLCAEAKAIPVVALGGFSAKTPELINSAFAAGANAIAVRRAFVQDDVQTSIPPLLNHIAQCIQSNLQR